jgi:hypothetical protein
MNSINDSLEHQPPGSSPVGARRTANPNSSYYLPRGSGRYEPTRATESPWDRKAQHSGPPAALLVHVIGQVVEAPMRIGRISLVFLGPIPFARSSSKSPRSSLDDGYS